MGLFVKTILTIPFLIAFLGLSSASVYYSNYSINGSTYDTFCNNGNIENCTTLNRSDAYSDIANGDTWPDIANRFKWLRWQQGYGVINNNGFAFTQFNNMSGWNTSTANTSTYWQADSKDHEVIGSHMVDVLWRYWQNENDSYISYHIEANSTPAFNFAQDTYLAFTMLGINIGNNGNCDSILYSNDSDYHGISLCTNTSVMLYNVTYLKVQDFAISKAWDFDFTQNTSAFVYLKPQVGQHGETINAQVYVGWKIGRSLTKYAIDWNAIDATCSTNCASQTFTYGDDFNTVQVEQNGTFGCSWAGDPPSCTTANCQLSIWARDPLYVAQYSQVQTIGLPPYYVACNSGNQTPGIQQCIGGVMAVTDPAQNTEILWSAIDLGVYNRPGTINFGQYHCGFSGAAANHHPITGTDTIAPQSPFQYINGQLFTNNSIVTVYSTNGSLAYTNVTSCWQWGNNSNEWFGNNGTLNVTAQRWNLTGYGSNGWNVSTTGIWMPDYLHCVNYPNVPNNTFIQDCGYANGTNRGSGTGDSNYSTTGAFYCWTFRLNIVPAPASGATTSPLTPTPQMQDEEDEPDQTLPYIMIGFVAACLIGFAAVKTQLV